METAKVDLRKLQLLNDRIAQVIDALNQVRFSVHGLQHTGAGFVPGNIGYNTFGWQQPYPQQFGQQFGAQQFGGQPVTPFGVPGLNHSSPELHQDPYARIREEQRLAQEMSMRYGQVPSSYGIDPRPMQWGWGTPTV
jgi:hypothetical protein